MPELPEVETMVRGVRSALVGRRIERLEVVDPFLVRGTTAAELEARVRGAQVRAVLRRGKSVLIGLGPSGGYIVIHPRMTGGFWLVEPDRPQHVRLIFRMADEGGLVWFRDTRRLGRVSWQEGEEFAGALGPDALEVTMSDLAGRLAATRRSIKATLLDQKVLAGIGNIYADEVLFQAGLHPSRKASSLSRAELTRLHAAIAPVLLRAIELEGSSFDGDYRTLLGKEGGYLKQALVHLRAGEACRSCEGLIVKTYIEGLIGRPTYFCPRCQPASGRAGRRGPNRVS